MPRAPVAPQTALQRARAGFEVMAAYEGRLSAVITPMHQEALEAARLCDEATARGQWLGLLHGMTVAVKDNLDTAGTRTTYGSSFFADHVPGQDAPAVARLRAAGAVLLAKANLAEFALGATTQNAHFGSCRNPWDTDRIPGGSSGGSAVAVASGMCVGALGTDTGGSIRVPAALTGLCGLRPTLGRISTRGKMPLSHRFDTVGPLAHWVTDVARIFAVLDRYDPADPSCHPGDRREVLSVLRDGAAGLRVGIPSQVRDDLDPEIELGVRTAAAVLVGLGAALVPVVLPGFRQAQARMGDLLYPDAIAVHAERMRTAPEGFGADVLRRLHLGDATTAAASAASAQWRTVWQRRLDEVFTAVDVVLTPTVPVLAPLAAGVDMIEASALLGRLTCPWSMAAGPTLSVPCGFSTGGLPFGMQLSAPAWQEARLFRVGAAYQEVTDWHLRRPSLEPAPAQTSAGRGAAEHEAGPR